MGKDDAPICACGTFAIGVCRACRATVCGEDSDRIGGLRFCSACSKQDLLVTQAQADAALAAEQASKWRHTRIAELREAKAETERSRRDGERAAAEAASAVRAAAEDDLRDSLEQSAIDAHLSAAADERDRRLATLAMPKDPHDRRVLQNLRAYGPIGELLVRLNQLDERARAAKGAQREALLSEWRALRSHLGCGELRCSSSPCAEAGRRLT